MFPSTHLARSTLFRKPGSTHNEKLTNAYLRAKAVADAYAFTPHDILHLSPKFWSMHLDPLCTMDGAAFTLLTIQLNLAAGTLAPFVLNPAEGREDLRPLLESMIRFDVSGQFLLSEVGHGLDAKNLETTVTLLPSGEFDLHTPSRDAAKWMPPTAPVPGIIRVGIVFARLIVHGENKGIRPFVVQLANGMQMCKGVSSKLLPLRAGSRPVDHALTFFNHVRLPSSALLGPLSLPSKPNQPADLRTQFFSSIWRVTIGSLALSTLTVPTLNLAAFIAGKYSLRRTVANPSNPLSPRQPIFSFRTQQRPILYALAIAAVLKAFAEESIEMFMDPKVGGADPRLRSGIAATLKAIMVHHGQLCFYDLSERCGAQGLFEYNQIIEHQLELRGMAIAEGDSLVLCIRLASELLLGRYALPFATDPTSLIAKHEAGLFHEALSYIRDLPGHHRSQEFNAIILPLCQPLIRAIGQRTAYEAAIKRGVDPLYIELYESFCIRCDESWYIENAESTGMSRKAIHLKEEKALSEAAVQIERLLEETNMEEYAMAPIVSSEAWNDFVNGLETRGVPHPVFSKNIPGQDIFSGIGVDTTFDNGDAGEGAEEFIDYPLPETPPMTIPTNSRSSSPIDTSSESAGSVNQTRATSPEIEPSGNLPSLPVAIKWSRLTS